MKKIPHTQALESFNNFLKYFIVLNGKSYMCPNYHGEPLKYVSLKLQRNPSYLGREH